jgi:hypothetical protein
MIITETPTTVRTKMKKFPSLIEPSGQILIKGTQRDGLKDPNEQKCPWGQMINVLGSGQ